jgi:hypothetical protein
MKSEAVAPEKTQFALSLVPFKTRRPLSNATAQMFYRL